MAHDAYVRDKSKTDILRDLGGGADVGSIIHEQQKMAILVRCTEDLEQKIDGLAAAINESSKQSGKVSQALFWATLVIAVATMVGAIATAMMAWKAQ